MIEIAIQGPRRAISELLQKLKGLSWTPKFSLKEVEGNGAKAKIVFVEEEAGFDETLLRLSRIVTDLEKTFLLENKFEFRTKNLAYAVPEGSSRRHRMPFSPIPSITIQSWHPSFQSATDSGTVIIDSDNAFGTGGHPTSRLCLECLEKLAGNKSPDWGLEGWEVLDFGCGTGLLAIAAVKMGAARAKGVDIVQETAHTAKRNVQLNRLTEKIVIRWGGWDQVDQRYDLILANLVASALLRSGGQISQYLKEDGRAVISGFSRNQMGDMESFFRAAGLKTILRSALDGWGLLFMERGPRIQEPFKTNRARHKNGG